MPAHAVELQLVFVRKQARRSVRKLTVYVMHIVGDAPRVCCLLLVNNLCNVCMSSKALEPMLTVCKLACMQAGC